MKRVLDVTSGLHMHRYTDMHPSAHTGTYPQKSTHAVHAYMHTNAHAHALTHTQREGEELSLLRKSGKDSHVNQITIKATHGDLCLCPERSTMGPEYLRE